MWMVSWIYFSCLRESRGIITAMIVYTLCIIRYQFMISVYVKRMSLYANFEQANVK